PRPGRRRVMRIVAGLCGASGEVARPSPPTSVLLPQIPEQGLLPPLLVDDLEHCNVNGPAIGAAYRHRYAIPLRVEDVVEHFDITRQRAGCDPGQRRLVIAKGVDRAGLQGC